MAVSGAYTYTLSGSDATITDYSTAVGGYSPTIPTMLDGYNVTKIDTNAMREKSLTSVTFNHAVELGSYCFKGNVGINVNLNATVTVSGVVSSSGLGPFEECSIGTGLTINNGVKTIPAYCFYNSGLTSVSLPSSVTAIKSSAFRSNSISSITFNSAVELDTYCFESNIGIDVILNATITVSSGVSGSGLGPFEGCSIRTGLTINSGVTTIQSYCFYNSGLTSVSLPSSVTAIKSSAFRSNSIGSITFNSAVELDTYCFKGNAGIDVIMNATITVSSGVSFVGLGPFDDCSIGTGLTINSGVTTIPEYCFNNSGLTSVSLPSSVTAINNSSFRSNSGLADFYVYNNSVTFGTNVLQGNMSASPKGTIYGGDPSNTKTWWTNNYTSTYNFSSNLLRMIHNPVFRGDDLGNWNRVRRIRNLGAEWKTNSNFARYNSNWNRLTT